jgi:hypothetical protein
MMNKRILELSKEAGSVADATYAKGPDAIWLREYNKKFAELIVRECQTVVEWAISVDSTIDRVPVLIQEHFGVEQ